MYNKKHRDDLIIAIVIAAKNMVADYAITASDDDIRKFSVDLINRWYTEKIDQDYTFEEFVDTELRNRFGRNKNIKSMKNMTVGDLKDILKDIPEHTPILLGTIRPNSIYMNYVRTAGIVTTKTEPDSGLCLCSTSYNKDLNNILLKSGRTHIKCTKLLF